MKKKQELFEGIDEVAKNSAIFASNTSTLCITELMSAAHRVDRFIGLHFFNPVPALKLVEVAPTFATDPAVVETVCQFVAKLGKTAVVVRDSAGFIVNRLLVPYLLDAIVALEKGLGAIADIDSAMQLGAGHPMGPLTLNDFIGLDVVYAMGQNLFAEFQEPRFLPPPLLKRMVLAGYLGRKNGKGFYDYSSRPPRPNDWLLGRGLGTRG
jgi:3-hydroxybutyryl-CoA dehydrogenase